jgi:thioredoxin 1
MNLTEKTSKPVQLNNGNFDSEVIESKLPVLVAFLTEWSRPCAVLLPVLDEIASECAGNLKVVRVNADTNLDLSLWYDVQSIPMLLYFVSGTVRAKIVGTATKEAILAKLDSMSKAAAETTNPCAVDLCSGAHKPKGE